MKAKAKKKFKMMSPPPSFNGTREQLTCSVEIPKGDEWGLDKILSKLKSQVPDDVIVSPFEISIKHEAEFWYSGATSTVTAEFSYIESDTQFAQRKREYDSMVKEYDIWKAKHADEIREFQRVEREKQEFAVATEKARLEKRLKQLNKKLAKDIHS